MSTYKKRKGHEITVVFDGWKTGEAKESSYIINGIKVIYTRIGENADSVIKRIISRERYDWIVITSDRDIADFAFSSGATPVSSEKFLNIYRRQETCNYENEDTLNETVYPQHIKKGSSRKPSKKEKLIIRAIKKL